jgi:hypothetical protein
MPRAVSRERQKGPGGNKLPQKVVEKINKIVAKTNVNDNQQKDDKHWQFVWLLILETVFIVFCPEIKNIMICILLITVFCYPFFKENDDKKKENDPTTFNEDVVISVIIKKKNLVSPRGGSVGPSTEEYIFFVNKDDLRSGISFDRKGYQPIYEDPQCSGLEGVEPWYQNCNLVSGDKVLFTMGSLHRKTQIIVKNGDQELLNIFV